MAKIGDLLAQGRTLSYEFFPPKTPAGVDNLRAAVADLAGTGPSFMSVTYGAGGSTRDLTAELVVEMNREQDFPVMAHLTCVGHTRDQVKALLDHYAASGVENILALAGDPPLDGSDPGGDFEHAIELVELIRAHGDFSVGVAAQPELHPRSPDAESDRRHLAAKLALADFGVTNFFFDPNDHLLMVEELADLGCHTPVLPGIMLFRNTGGLRRMSAMNGSKLPADDVMDRLDEVGDDEAAVVDVAVDLATLLGERLLAAGAPGIHLYALNRADAARRVVEALAL